MKTATEFVQWYLKNGPKVTNHAIRERFDVLPATEQTMLKRLVASIANNKDN